MEASDMNLLLPPIFVREFYENNPICAIEFFMSAIKLRKLQRMKNKKMYEYATNCVDLLHIISFSIAIYFLMPFVTLCCVLYLHCVGEVDVFLILSTYEVHKTLDRPLNSRLADIKDVRYVPVHSPCSNELQAYLHLHK